MQKGRGEAHITLSHYSLLVLPFFVSPPLVFFVGLLHVLRHTHIETRRPNRRHRGRLTQALFNLATLCWQLVTVGSSYVSKLGRFRDGLGWEVGAREGFFFLLPVVANLGLWKRTYDFLSLVLKDWNWFWISSPPFH